MNFTFKKLTTKFVTMGLALTVALSAYAAVLPHSAYAMSSTQKANNVINKANAYLGRPYEFGASTNTTRVFDCSSLTKYVFGKNGIYLPRTSSQQAKMGSFVSRSNLRKGDLLFFSTRGSHGKIAHVGIYAGGGRMINTYQKGIGVTYTNINSAFWKAHYKTARRVF